MLKRLSEERKGKVDFIEGLTNTAAGENRDLSTNELELVTRSKDRIKEIDDQINVLAVDVELSEQASARLAKLAGATTGSTGGAPSDVEYRSNGAYLADFIASHVGQGEERGEAEDRLRRYHRAAAHITTGNFAGTFSDPLVGSLVNLINTSRPLVGAMGTIPIPAGPSFRRPRLNDPNVDTGVDLQANQKDELSSKPFTVSSDNVDLSTVGGYVNLALQVVQWGVASVDQVISQLARRYAYKTERLTLAEIQKSTSHVPLAAGAAADVVLKAIYSAAATVFSETTELPTMLLSGPLGWARLGGLSSTGGVPTFPFLAPSNANGSMSAATFNGNPVGLQLVVTPAITDDTYWVLNGASLEIYEQQLQPLQVLEPSVIGTQIALAGYCGFFRPAPNGAVHVSP